MQDARALASVIGEEELSEVDQKYMYFGRMFEEHFVCQGARENREIGETLDLGWLLLSLLPREELDRVDRETLDKFYRPEQAVQKFGAPKE